MNKCSKSCRQHRWCHTSCRPSTKTRVLRSCSSTRTNFKWGLRNWRGGKVWTPYLLKLVRHLPPANTSQGMKEQQASRQGTQAQPSSNQSKPTKQSKMEPENTANATANTPQQAGIRSIFQQTSRHSTEMLTLNSSTAKWSKWTIWQVVTSLITSVTHSHTKDLANSTITSLVHPLDTTGQILSLKSKSCNQGNCWMDMPSWKNSWSPRLTVSTWGIKSTIRSSWRPVAWKRGI